MTGPNFGYEAAKTLSDEVTRAEQGEAGAARAHRLEDLEAARARSAGEKRGSRFRVVSQFD
jgi:hypothetical protein